MRGAFAAAGAAVLGVMATMAWPLAAAAEDAPAASGACTQGAAEDPACRADADATQPETPADRMHFFGNFNHPQAMQDQVALAVHPGPLPIMVSGNVQRWMTGPPLKDLDTQVAQGLFRVNDKWTVVAQQLYQQQGPITLANLVAGFNYKPDEDWSINATLGAGIHTLYTYQWSGFISPQYQLPLEIAGRKRISVEAGLTFEQYQLGTFTQILPKVNLHVASWLPQVSVGYAEGHFHNSTPVSATQYYQPQTVHGFALTAVTRPLDSVYVVVSYLPVNRNYIAGSNVTQDTVSGTIHWNLTDSLRLSVFGQFQDVRGGGSDNAFGGGVNFTF